jgi:hypothetical protein
MVLLRAIILLPNSEKICITDAQNIQLFSSANHFHIATNVALHGAIKNHMKVGKIYEIDQ